MIRSGADASAETFFVDRTLFVRTGAKKKLLTGADMFFLVVPVSFEKGILLGVGFSMVGNRGFQKQEELVGFEKCKTYKYKFGG